MKEPIRTLSEIELNQMLPEKGIEPRTKLKWRPETYTVTNGTEDRTYDADATNVAELADILATLIADLRDAGIVR